VFAGGLHRLGGRLHEFIRERVDSCLLHGKGKGDCPHPLGQLQVVWFMVGE
jgi:hypothetical protein